jgi:hypothetical protein
MTEAEKGVILREGSPDWQGKIGFARWWAANGTEGPALRRRLSCAPPQSLLALGLWYRFLYQDSLKISAGCGLAKSKVIDFRGYRIPGMNPFAPRIMRASPPFCICFIIFCICSN